MTTTRPIMQEAMVDCMVDEALVTTFLCTPEYLPELAAGWLYSQGRIAGMDDLAAVDEAEGRVVVRTRKGLLPATNLREHLELLSPITTDMKLDMARIASWIHRLLEQDEHYGTHCVGAVFPDDTFLFREDAGRHNAMDKVIGRRMMDGGTLREAFFLCTGRISLEMLAKTASAGVPVVVTKKYPSDLGVAWAQRLGVTIVGYAAGAEPCVFSHPGRIR